MRNYLQQGEVLTLAPAAAVASGVGHLFGAALFGVALADVPAGTPGPFITEGVVEIAKTSAAVIAVGARLYWDPAARVVNVTATAQQHVGIAVAAAGAGVATVQMKLVTGVALAA